MFKITVLFSGFFRQVLRVTEENSISETTVWPSFLIFINIITAFEGTHFQILFAITAAGVVPCGGPKRSPRISSIVQIMFSFSSFEIREGIWGSLKILLGSDSFSKQFYNIGLNWVYISPFVDCPVKCSIILTFLMLFSPGFEGH